MRIYVNGEERSALQHTTVEELLTSLGLAQRPCAVEVNRTLVPRREHARWRLEQDDRVEIVELVGGG
ncbi:MAG: sulfur carrier protein ThiS [Planctomycetota bacterium]|nr:MAG: sulfur carrier protein ThiS [Planctomycetota bacterium]